jgi:hypothetical protein
MAQELVLADHIARTDSVLDILDYDGVDRVESVLVWWRKSLKYPAIICSFSREVY